MEIQTLINNTNALSIEQALAARNKSAPITKAQLVEATRNAINAIEARNWKTGEGYKAPSYPLFTQKLEGLESGLYLFAGESNVGYCALS